jgi:CheY-like chemotaxis protein
MARMIDATFDSQSALRDPFDSPLVGIRVLVGHYDVHESGRYGFALRAAGATVIAVSSLDEAAELCESWRPHAVVSGRVARTPSAFDCALLRAVRRLEGARGFAPPVVALTPWVGIEARSELLALGFKGHCARPCTMEAVVAEILFVAIAQARDFAERVTAR